MRLLCWILGHDFYLDRAEQIEIISPMKRFRMFMTFRCSRCGQERQRIGADYDNWRKRD